MRKEYEYVTELREWLTLRNYATSTISGYSSSLRQFLVWQEGQEFGPEIDAGHVRRYCFTASVRWSVSSSCRTVYLP